MGGGRRKKRERKRKNKKVSVFCPLKRVFCSETELVMHSSYVSWQRRLTAAPAFPSQPCSQPAGLAFITSFTHGTKGALRCRFPLVSSIWNSSWSIAGSCWSFLPPHPFFILFCCRTELCSLWMKSLDTKQFFFRGGNGQCSISSFPLQQMPATFVKRFIYFSQLLRTHIKTIYFFSPKNKCPLK